MSNTISSNQFEILNGMYGIPVRIEEDEYTVTVYFINQYDCTINIHTNDERHIHQRTFTKECLNGEELEQIRTCLDRYNRRTMIRADMLSDDKLDKIGPITASYRNEQNRLALKMVNQPGALIRESSLSITIWNRVPKSKRMTSWSFEKKYLDEETLKVLRSHK